MKREYKKVYYSYEHGDKSLPHLKDMVSEKPDPEKDRILAYLSTNCIAACPGIIRDEITPEKIIGSGNLYSDGVYYWNDQLYGYVKRYNIPLPTDFRSHILENYDRRMKQHLLLRLTDKVEIENDPYLGYSFKTVINRNGLIQYSNNTDQKDGIILNINADDARYIIDPIMTQLFCYDEDEHGEATIDGYHWKLTFFKRDKLLNEIEGWTGEDQWRHKQIKRIIEFAERYIPKDLGSAYMDI